MPLYMLGSRKPGTGAGCRGLQPACTDSCAAAPYSASNLQAAVHHNAAKEKEEALENDSDS